MTFPSDRSSRRTSIAHASPRRTATGPLWRRGRRHRQCRVGHGRRRVLRHRRSSAARRRSTRSSTSARTVTQAGPIGEPGIALDANGNPWIAFTVETSKGREVHVAHLDGGKWTDEVAASAPNCNGCALAAADRDRRGRRRSASSSTRDASGGTVDAARLEGAAWTASQSPGLGACRRRRALASRPTARPRSRLLHRRRRPSPGHVREGGAWSTTDARRRVGATTRRQTSENLAPSTAAAVDRTAPSTSPGPTRHSISPRARTRTPSRPSTSATRPRTRPGRRWRPPTTGVALSWYDPVGQNQMVGFLRRSAATSSSRSPAPR